MTLFEYLAIAFGLHFVLLMLALPRAAASARRETTTPELRP